MKGLTKFFLVCCLIFVLSTNVSQSIFSIHNQHTTRNTTSALKPIDDDCYTYERVFNNGEWWILVYDCDGVYVGMHLEEEE